MSNRQMICDPERIELFLTQQLEDHEQTAFELHLDDCTACRHQLEVAAAGEEIWSGVRDSLQGQSERLRSAGSSDAVRMQSMILSLLMRLFWICWRQQMTIRCWGDWERTKSQESSEQEEWGLY